MDQLPAAGLWTADPTRTTASFEAANFIVNRVPGTIAVRSGAVETDQQGRPTSVSAVLDSGSITTGNPRRDKDLRATRFFNVANHPIMSFTSTVITSDNDGGWTVAGALAVGEKMAPISLTVQLRQPSDAGTVQVVARGSIDRAAAGIKAPSFMIGRAVLVTIDAVLSLAPTRVTV